MRIYIIGSLNMDLVIRAPRVPEAGETLSGEGFMTNPGGKGANQAVAVAKAGGEAHMVGCVGREFGKELSDALTQYGVHTDYVRAEENVSSGIAVIVVADGDNRIILDTGSNARADEALVDRALATAQAGDYLLLQLEIPLSTVGYALKRAKERGMITVLNPAPAAKRWMSGAWTRPLTARSDLRLHVSARRRQARRRKNRILPSVRQRRALFCSKTRICFR